MDKIVFEKIWEIQDLLRADLEYGQLLHEHEILNTELLTQLETMNECQRNAVLNYCGLLIEMHLKILEHSIHNYYQKRKCDEPG